MNFSKPIFILHWLLAACLAYAAPPAKGKVPWALKFAKEKPLSLDDASRMNSTRITELWPIPSDSEKAESQLQSLLERAHQNNLAVSIAGARHSMGGHSIAPDGIVVDMRPFRDLELLDEGRILRAGSGALWSQILAFLDPNGLSVGVMQSNNSFSVGGSLSVNCHGWQYNRPPIASTVEAFRLMKSDGSVVRCSREENKELFSLVLGGYGLFGIILEADLRTVPNRAYKLDRKVLPFGNAIPYYNEHLRNNRDIDMAYARLNIVPKKLFDDIIISAFRPIENAKPPLMRPPSKTFVRRSIFRFSAKSDTGKKLRWNAERSLERKLQPDTFSRNQLLNEGVEIFANRSAFTTDILHEYFVPPEMGRAFVDTAGTAILKNKANLLNVTIRSVEKDHDSLLRYAPEQRMAFVMLFHQRRTQAAEKAMETLTGELIEAALKLGGTYYLPYRLHATSDQFHRAYPQAKEFFKMKRKYDPKELFQNQFYLKYGGV